jgi:hypothetical protein
MLDIGLLATVSLTSAYVLANFSGQVYIVLSFHEGSCIASQGAQDLTEKLC